MTGYLLSVIGGVAFALNCIPLISQDTRIAINRDFDVPINECCHPCCAHYFCGPCALYQVRRFAWWRVDCLDCRAPPQEAVYLKRQSGDFACCCYVSYCKPMCGADGSGGGAVETRMQPARHREDYDL
jgi:hypothetical protein